MARLFRKLSGFKICMIVTLIVCAVYAYPPLAKILQPIELKALDYRFKVRGARNPGTEVAIIAVDDKSLEKIGRWPWPRSVFGRMVDTLTGAGARVIGFDILFLLPDRQTENSKIRHLMERYRELNLSGTGPGQAAFLKELEEAFKGTDNDEIFARSVKESGRVVLAHLLQPGRTADTESKGLKNLHLYKGVYPQVGKRDEKSKRDSVQAKAIMAPIEPLTVAAGGLGYANTFPDEDGSLRMETLAMEYGGEYFMSLSVAMLKLYLNLNPQQIRLNPGEDVELGRFGVDTDERNRFLINYYGPTGTYPYFSFYDVLEGKKDASLFKDKIVFIGYTAAGIKDFYVTPTDPGLPGVEKQATIVSNILHQDFIIRNRVLIAWDIFFILVSGLILGLTIPKLPPLRATLFSILLLIFMAAFLQAIFSYAKLWVYAVYPLLTIALAYSCTLVFRLFTEEREKKRIRDTFQFYVTPSVVSDVLKNPEKLKLGGDRKDLTVLFSDIAGFTTVSESMSPEDLVHFLNEYLTKMTDIVFKYDGTLDKFIGDAVMAIYGAPLDDPDHPAKACGSALDMMTALALLRKGWEQRGMPLIDIRIGINTGPMVVGNMGSQSRFDYTVMGDSVNLGSRLEGINKEYGTNIIISEETFHHVTERFVCRRLDAVRVKGKKAPVKIFELIGLRGAWEGDLGWIKTFEEGLNLYAQREWRPAIVTFESVLGEKPGDAPSRIYVQRCAEYLLAPPPEEWDTVYTMTKK
ncbi:MAG: adenylate/guanylate cyclase domain-containing protein [Pseudomonadota bacterium]